MIAYNQPGHYTIGSDEIEKSEIEKSALGLLFCILATPVSIDSKDVHFQKELLFKFGQRLVALVNEKTTTNKTRCRYSSTLVLKSKLI